MVPLPPQDRNYASAKTILLRAASRCDRRHPESLARIVESHGCHGVRVALLTAWTSVRAGCAASAIHYAMRALREDSPDVATPLQQACAHVLCAVGWETCAADDFAKAQQHWADAASQLEAYASVRPEAAVFGEASLLVVQHGQLCERRARCEVKKADAADLGGVLLTLLVPAAVLRAQAQPYHSLVKSLAWFEGTLDAASTSPRAARTRAATPVPAISYVKTRLRLPTDATAERAPLLADAEHRTPTKRRQKKVRQQPSSVKKASPRAGAPPSPPPPTPAAATPRGPNRLRHSVLHARRATSRMRHQDPCAPVGREAAQPAPLRRRRSATKPPIARASEQGSPSPAGGGGGGETHTVLRDGVVGMTFDAMRGRLLALKGWAEAPRLTAARGDFTDVDVYLGEKLPVEALIEECTRHRALRGRSGTLRKGGGAVVEHSQLLGGRAGSALGRRRPLYVNYFLGSRVVTLKSRMVECLRAYMRTPYTITPTTFILSPRSGFDDERGQFLAWRAEDTKAPVAWIAKSSHGSKGLGIQISRDRKALVRYIDSQEKRHKWVVQLYLQNPFLLDGRKFDIRTWVLLGPDMRVWVYRRGVCRTSGYKYDAKKDDFSDQLTHITNHFIQDGSPMFEAYEKGNEVWFDQLHSFMQSLPGKPSFYDDVEPQLCSITRKVFEAAAPHVTQAPSPLVSFQLFGFDFLVDDSLKVWLLEVNGSPAIAEYLKVCLHGLHRDLGDVRRRRVPQVTHHATPHYTNHSG